MIFLILTIFSSIFAKTHNFTYLMNFFIFPDITKLTTFQKMDLRNHSLTKQFLFRFQLAVVWCRLQRHYQGSEDEVHWSCTRADDRRGGWELYRSGLLEAVDVYLDNEVKA